jgi:uncharacterized protein (DUF1697 family)
VPQYVCFLRGINVGGKNTIKMAELKALFEALGFADVQTLLQSGNAVFGAKGSAARISAQIAQGLEAELGVTPEVILRTVAQVREALQQNPFRAEAKRDPSHLLIMFLAGKPTADAKKALAALDIAPEKIALGPREAYLWYPGGIGTSKKLGRLPIEKLLGTFGTSRNVRTVEALLAPLLTSK